MVHWANGRTKAGSKNPIRFPEAFLRALLCGAKVLLASPLVSHDSAYLRQDRAQSPDIADAAAPVGSAPESSPARPSGATAALTETSVAASLPQTTTAAVATISVRDSLVTNADYQARFRQGASCSGRGGGLFGNQVFEW